MELLEVIDQRIAWKELLLKGEFAYFENNQKRQLGPDSKGKQQTAWAKQRSDLRLLDSNESKVL